MDGFRSPIVPGSRLLCVLILSNERSDKTDMLFFRLIKLEPEILSCQNLKSCCRVLYLQDMSDLHNQQQAAALQQHSRG